MPSFSGMVDGQIDPHLRFHYSQLGEDVLVGHILDAYLPSLKNGFYVDVGCFHPCSLSNTRLLYLQGWRGINVDASKSAIEAFQAERPDDISIHCGIAKESGVRPYYVFEFAAASTLDPATRDAWLANGWKQIATEEIQVGPLAEVLAPYLPPSQTVDYLNIDVEGLDFEALNTFDFERHKPKIISIEVHGLDLLRAYEHPVVQFLAQKGYQFLAHSLVTSIFLAKS